MGSQSANKKKEASNNKAAPKDDAPRSTAWYILALLPLPFLILSSILLKSTISSPPSDFGSGSMFDQIAPRYDFINRALALNQDMSWRHRLVSEVVGSDGQLFQGRPNVKILDLATGTADVAILLGKQAEKHTQQQQEQEYAVLGLDPSQNMLNVGNKKVNNSNLSSIVHLQVGDVRKLQLETDSFDAVTMSFGIRNVPQKEDALCEIHRVIKKESSADNVLAIMEFSEPDEDSGMMGSLARVFIRHMVPSLGALLSGAPKEYMHLQKSIKDFPSPREFVALMEGLKCPVVRDGEVKVDTFGMFRVKKVVNLNFGSVQIYLATPVLRRRVTG